MPQADIHSDSIEAGSRTAEHVMEQVFGDREKLDQSAKNAWDMLELTPRYVARRDEVKTILSNTARRVFDAVGKRMEKAGRVHEKTLEQLKALDTLVRETVTVGQTMKMETSPYASESGKDVMDDKEILQFISYIRRIEDLSEEEMVEMVVDSNPFARMLAQMRGLDTTEAPMLDQANPDYAKHIRGLRDFIWDRNKEKSDGRKHTEATLWGRIIQEMSKEQREDLIVSFSEEGPEGAREGQEMLKRAVANGVLSYTDVLALTNELWGEVDDDGKVVREGSAGFHVEDSAKFKKDLEQARDESHDMQKLRDDMGDIMQRTFSGNAANHYLSFNNVIWSRVADLGVLTAFMNAVVTLSAEMKDAPAGIGGKVQGLVNTVSKLSRNKYFYLGLAEVAVALDQVGDGWLRKKFLYSPSKTEKEVSENMAGEKRIRNIVTAYPGVHKYLADHYDDLYATATRNENGGGRVFELKYSDVKFTDAEYSSFGVGSEKEVRRRFHDNLSESMRILGKTFELKSAENVKAYFAEAELPFEFSPETKK
ncbi:MAG: hypothetical protein AAB592_05670 [Patescibacteria group bacterium]